MRSGLLAYLNQGINTFYFSPSCRNFLYSSRFWVIHVLDTDFNPYLGAYHVLRVPRLRLLRLQKHQLRRSDQLRCDSRHGGCSPLVGTPHAVHRWHLLRPIHFVEPPCFHRLSSWPPSSRAPRPCRRQRLQRLHHLRRLPEEEAWLADAAVCRLAYRSVSEREGRKTLSFFVPLLLFFLTPGVRHGKISVTQNNFGSLISYHT